VGVGDGSAIVCKVCDTGIPVMMIMSAMGGDEEYAELVSGFQCGLCLQAGKFDEETDLLCVANYHSD
jgi:hypothetical protein